MSRRLPGTSSSSSKAEAEASAKQSQHQSQSLSNTNKVTNTTTVDTSPVTNALTVTGPCAPEYSGSISGGGVTVGGDNIDIPRQASPAVAPNLVAAPETYMGSAAVGAALAVL